MKKDQASVQTTIRWSDLASPVLIYGPAYSGKSDWAQRCLNPSILTLVLGTHEPEDPVFLDRIKDLKDRRPGAWQSVDAPKDALSSLDLALSGKESVEQVLIDNLTQWLGSAYISILGDASRELTDKAALHEVEPRMRERWQELLLLISRHKDKRWVLIANEVTSGLPPARGSDRWFRRLCGQLHLELAHHCPTIIEMRLGCPSLLKNDAAGESR